MIEPLTLALLERRDRLGRWVRAWNQCFPPPLIHPEGQLLPCREGFSPLCQALDSATPGRNALRAEWHSGNGENSFFGVCNLMQFYEYMLLTWANPATLNIMWSEMFDNLPPQFCIRCGAQAGNLRWEESASLEQDWTLSSYSFDSWTPQAMLSFCAKTWGGVAESMIEQWTLALREGGRLGRWVRAWNPCVSPHLISPDRRMIFTDSGIRIDSGSALKDCFMKTFLLLLLTQNNWSMMVFYISWTKDHNPWFNRGGLFDLEVGSFGLTWIQAFW